MAEPQQAERDLREQDATVDRAANLEAEGVSFEENARLEPVTFHESTSDVQEAYDGLMPAAPVEPVTLMEAGAEFDEAKREIIIRPIRPGFGNKRDGFYYPKPVLREAIESGVFTNRKMFADHPTRGDEAARPERSVWDWVSTLKEAWWDAQSDEPRARIKVYDDRFWSRAKAAPDEIAFSILGGGLARPGRVEGRDARIVESLSSIRSVDWVTEAGAGGGITAFAESAHEELEMELESMTLEQLKEARPDIVLALLREAEEDDDEEMDADEESEDVETAEADTDEEADEESDEDESDEVETTEADADESDESDESDEEEESSEDESAEQVDAKESALEQRLAALEAELRESKAREQRVQSIQNGAKILDAELRESTLPAFAKDQVRARFAEAGAGEGFAWPDDDTLRAAIRNELKMTDDLVSKLGVNRKVSSIGGADDGVSVREAVSASLTEQWGIDAIPTRATADPALDEGTGEGAAVADSEQPTRLSEAGVSLQRDLESRFDEYDV